MWHASGKKEMHTEFRWGNLKERYRPVDYIRTRMKGKMGRRRME
jgi:hypothetical protein